MVKQYKEKVQSFKIIHCLGLVICFLLTFVLSGCSSSPNNKNTTTNDNQAMENVSSTSIAKNSFSAKSTQPIVVSINNDQRKEIGLEEAVVKQGFVYKTIECPGRVGPNAELSRLVSSPTAGRATVVKARLGDTVQTGQEMAIIKSDQIGQVQSDLLQSTLQARADIKQQEVQLKLSKVTYQRESTLYKEQVSAQADLQTAENQLEKDEANLIALKAKMEATIRVAQERLTLLGAPPDSARKVIAQNKIDPWVIIKSPESGLVIDRSINPGEMNDGSKSLFTITDLSEVWLFGDIFEKDIESVKKGQEAIVTVDSLPDHKFPAKIIWVGDSINPTTRTLPVRANVANPDELLKPGMFARMTVDAGKVSVLVVPSSSIIQKGDKSLVFIKNSPSTYLEQEVEIGIDDGNNVEILSGLKSGDWVVSNGGTALLGEAMKSSEGK